MGLKMCMQNMNRVRNNCLFSNGRTDCEAGVNGRGQTSAHLKGALPVTSTLRLATSAAAASKLISRLVLRIR